MITIVTTITIAITTATESWAVKCPAISGGAFLFQLAISCNNWLVAGMVPASL